MKKISLIFFIVTAVFFASFSPAFGALVPCGGEGQNPCTLCDLGVLIANIIEFLLYFLLAPFAVLSVLAAGLLILTAAGDENRLNWGKSIFKNAVFGIIIAFSAYLVVITILDAVLSEGFIKANWSKFPKVIELKCT